MLELLAQIVDPSPATSWFRTSSVQPLEILDNELAHGRTQALKLVRVRELITQCPKLIWGQWHDFSSLKYIRLLGFSFL